MMIQKNIINKTIKIIDYLKLDKNLTGYIIIFFHIIIAIIFGIFIVFSSNINTIYILIVLLFIQTICFLIFKGCILTRVEQILTDNKYDGYTITDPLLKILDIAVNNKTRYYLTIIIILIGWIILLLKIYLK